MSTSDFTKTWIERPQIMREHQAIPVRQVYVWLITTDNHLVIVSKDDKNWQLPGGKPEANESLEETAIRELSEETGIDISPVQTELNFFGYYAINEPAKQPADYLQVRYILNLPISSTSLRLHAQGESANQSAAGVVRFVKAIELSEVGAYIPWMPESDEYATLVRTLLI